MNIDGKEYIEINKLPKEFGIFDATKCMMLLHVAEDNRRNELIDITSSVKASFHFKLSEMEKIKYNFDKQRIYTPNNIKISNDFFKRAETILKALSHGRKAIKMELYEGWNEETKEWRKDYPVALVYDDYLVVIAPMVENE